MAIELSNLMFTNQDDIVPSSGVIERLINTGIANSLAGNDRLTGYSDGSSWDYYQPSFVNSGTLDTGEGNDIISGHNTSTDGIYNSGTLDTGEGNDTITGFGYYNGIVNSGTFNTGEGDDEITGGYGRGSGIYFTRDSIFDTGDGNDRITAPSYGGLRNSSNNFTTGDGNDTIGSFSSGPHNRIYNEGVINTGNGDDLINGTVIYNNGGAIITGNGNDSIYTGGFESSPNSSGAWFLGEGEDYIQGFGSGDFYGGNGMDTLELTPGTYTVGIWGEGGESPIFTKGNQLMITSEFERLIAGGTIYDFTSLTAGQIIVVA
jgi:hypothetical protein